MAEFVQRQVEEQIPELEQLERVGLLTRGEVRSVMRRRTALEYKMRRMEVEKEDFIRYIQYEVGFLELLKKRRQRIAFSYKKEEIEFIIIQRIHRLFSRATNKWKEDLQLWMSHVAFCKKWNCKSKLSKIFSSLLAIHPDKPALWITAGKWEFEDRMSAESSRLLFLRSLRFHPESSKLYQEYFRMELMNAEKQRQEKAALEKAKMDVGEAGYSDDILDGGLARVVYKSAVQKIEGAEFHLSLLNIAQKFRFAEELQKEILSDLQTLHAGDPLMWDFLARQELLAPPSAEAGEGGAQHAAQQEEESHRIYQTALTALPREAMWDLYVAFCLQRYKRKTNSKELKQQRMERLLRAMQRAHQAVLLPPERYKEWISLLLEIGETELVLGVSSAATQRFGSSLQVWRTRLEVLMALKAEEVEEGIAEALTQVKAKDSAPLLMMLVEWSEQARRGADTEALYQKLVLNPAVTATMKEKFLDWTYRTHGYHRARKVFSSLHENHPFTEDFFRKMIDIEKEQEKSKMANLREYYERALREFGSVNPDLWLSYIREELSHSEGKPENCSAIHWRAMKMLQGDDVERFVNSYTLMQTGHL